MKGADEGGAIDGADGTGGAEWATLSKTLTSGALRKKKLLPGRAYVFRRRSKQVRVSALVWALVFGWVGGVVEYNVVVGCRV